VKVPFVDLPRQLAPYQAELKQTLDEIVFHGPTLSCGRTC
jgi:hypothetical protein